MLLEEKENEAKFGSPTIPLHPPKYKNMIVRTYLAKESANGSTDMHSKRG